MTRAVFPWKDSLDSAGHDLCSPASTSTDLESITVIYIKQIKQPSVCDGAWSRSMYKPKSDKKPKSNDEFYYY